MDKLYLKLKLLDPVIVTQKKCSNLLTYTKDYINPTALYGIFANLLVKNNLPLQHLENVCFSNAYITVIGNKHKYLITIPKPFSFQKIKG